MYNLHDKLHFGKYEGFSIEDIYRGQKFLSQKFLNDFLDFKLKKLKFKIDDYKNDLTKLSIIDVEIQNFQVLMNNYLSFDLNLFKSGKLLNNGINNFDSIFSEAFSWINFDLILDDRSEAVGMFDNPNEVIISINQERSEKHLPSSDANYINWCLKNLDIFILKSDDLINLQSETCYHFYGVNLFRGEVWNNIYKYEPNIQSFTYSFDEEAIEANQQKFNAL